jgi:hypothetical protein
MQNLGYISQLFILLQLTVVSPHNPNFRGFSVDPGEVGKATSGDTQHLIQHGVG